MRCFALVAVVAAACSADPSPATVPDAAPEAAGPDVSAAPDAAADALQDAAPEAPPMDAPPEASCGDTATDPLNCGRCGNRCSFPRATAVCVRGQCGVGACDTGRGDCDGTNANGCEEDLNENANCGACGLVCPGVSRCLGGVCEGACPAGMTYCRSGCVVTSANSMHCGRCGNVCPDGTTCRDGACVNPCPNARRYCVSNIDLNIACVDVSSGRRNSSGIYDHCGNCQTTCPPGEACFRGACGR